MSSRPSSPPFRFALLAGCLAAAGAVHAAEPDDGTCRNGTFARQGAPFGVAKVTGRERAPFLEDINGCPNDTEACQQRAYLTPNDLVLTGRTRGAYVCAYLPNRVGGSAGWMRRDRLAAQPIDPAPPPAAWAGVWRDGDDNIRLSVRGDALAAKGEAYWPSANPSLADRPGGPNTGDFEASARPEGAHLSLVDGGYDGCRVTLDRVGPWLVAADNQGCGGQNVSFTGVYSRR